MIKKIKDLKILMVDDEEELCRSVDRVLSKRVDTFEYVTSAKAAEDLIKTFPADIAILDINMPEKNGLELMQNFRVLYPDICIIMFSASLDFDSINFSNQKGAAYIEKPASPKEIIEKIKEVYASIGVEIEQ